MRLFRLSDRYVLSELLQPFVISTFAVLMMLVGNTLYNVMDKMLQLKWPWQLVMRMLILNVPTVLTMTLPVAVALAASLAVNRMARDNEMTTLRAAGQPLWRTFLPIVCFGALVSAGDFYLSEKVVPWAFTEQRNVEAILFNLPKDPIQGGRSISVDDYLISFNSVQQVVKGKHFRFNNVVLIQNANHFPNRNDGEFANIVTAASAEYENGVWELSRVHAYHFKPDGALEAVNASARAQINLRIDFSNVYSPPDDFAATQQSYAELTQLQTEALRQHRYDDARKLEVNRYFKWTLPLMCFVFALCAPPLCLRFARTGAFTGVLLSIVVVFVGWNTILLMKGIGLGGFVSPLVAALSTPLLFALFGLWLMRTQE